MREDRRRRYDDGFRREALEPVKAEAGRDTLARRLAMPRWTAEKWIRLYRSGGEETVMGGNGGRRYDWETKVAAARGRCRERHDQDGGHGQARDREHRGLTTVCWTVP